MSSIRYAALVVLVGLLFPLPGTASEGTDNAYRLDRLRQDRTQAAARRRRIIFNNDGNSIVYHLKETTPEALLAARTTPLIGTQVDSIFYSSWGSGFGMFTHISDVAQPFVAKTGPFKANRTGDFHEKGLDPLQIMVDFGKKHDIEIFWSMRMNDIHDAYPQWSALFPEFKKRHPEFLFTTRDNPPVNGHWSGLDYNHAPVRARALALLEDVCKRYDVDGVELDFLRHPPFFRSHASGHDCTEAECETMTDLIRNIRRMTEQEGLRRKRPILVAVRVPASAECCKEMGLDILRWMEEGLIDLAVPGEWEFDPWSDWVALGRKYGVKIYPCLNLSVQRGRKRAPGRKLPIMRARAMNMWHSGADGIYTFNFFEPESPAWREIGAVKTLARLDKDYYVNAYAPAMIEKYFKGHARFMKGPTLHPDRPIALAQGERHEFRLYIAEPPTATDPPPKVTLQIKGHGLTEPQDLTLTFNAQPLKTPENTADSLLYPLPFSALRQGENTVTLVYKGPGERVMLKDLCVRAVYR